MTTSLNVLILEDRPADAELILYELRHAGFDPNWQRVETQTDYCAALTPSLDLILADYSLPTFDGISALQSLLERGMDIPFILVSGSMGEDIAVNAVKQGAADYLLKDRLTRLGPAVTRALQEKQLRDAKRAADQTLRENEQLLSGFIRNSTDGFAIVDEGGRLIEWNDSLERSVGLPRREVIGRFVWDVQFELVSPDKKTPEYYERLRALTQNAFKDGQWPLFDANRETTILRADGSRRTIEETAFPIRTDTGFRIGLIMRDVTDRKRAQEALRLAEENYRSIFENATEGIYQSSPAGRFLHVNSAMARILGYESGDELIAAVTSIQDQFYADPKSRGAILEILREDGVLRNLERQVFRKEGGRIWISENARAVTDASGALAYYEGFIQDITGRKERERELQTIAAVSQALRSAHTRAEMMPIIVDQVLKLLHVQGAAVATVDPINAETKIELGGGAWESWTGIRLPPGQGVSGYVITTGKPYVAEDVQKDPKMTHQDLIADLNAAACVPLVVESQTIGVLWIGRNRRLSTGQVRLLTSIGDIAASAIHRAQLHEQTERNLQRLTALRTVDQAIIASFDLRIILGIIVDELVSEVGVDAADILIFDKSLQTLRYAAGRGFHSHALERSILRAGQGNAGRVVIERSLVSVHNPAEARDSSRAPLIAAEGFVSYVGVPLIAKGEIKGVLEAFHRSPFEQTDDWRSFLETLAGQAAIAIDNLQLFDGLQRSNSELTMAYDATLEGWSRALDLRDQETEGHTQRVTVMTEELARAMGLGGDQLIQIRRGTLLHDIGKIGIPDNILLKPGALTEVEWAIMRGHPDVAHELLAAIPFLRPALEIPYCHHEQWDGSGYPRGLKGEEIPLSARIFAVVDVYDALRSDRPYRSAWPERRVRNHIRDLTGKHFDPKVVETFLDMLGPEPPSDGEEYNVDDRPPPPRYTRRVIRL